MLSIGFKVMGRGSEFSNRRVCDAQRNCFPGGGGRASLFQDHSGHAELFNLSPVRNPAGSITRWRMRLRFQV